MWQIIRKQIRPDTTVNFFAMNNNPMVTDEFKQYWVSTYVTTDKCIYVASDVQDNGLEMIITAIWDSKESIDQMRNDPICIEHLHNVKDAYLEANNIQEILIETTEV